MLALETFKWHRLLLNFNLSVFKLHIQFTSKQFLRHFVIDEMVVVMVGYGQSKDAYIENKGDFMEQFMNEVKLNRPVLVCASMSGHFALPFVLRPDAATCTKRLSGFVPIAPVGTSSFTKADYSTCQVSFMQKLWDCQHTKKLLTDFSNSFESRLPL